MELHNVPLRGKKQAFFACHFQHRRIAGWLSELPVKPFNGLLQARRWATELVHWYNHKHRHSAIGFVTPAQRYLQLDEAILNDRAKVYAAARDANPN